MRVNNGHKVFLQLKSTDKILSNGVLKSKIGKSYELGCGNIESRAKLTLWELSKGFMKGISKSQCAMRKFKNTKIETRYDGSVLESLKNK